MYHPESTLGQGKSVLHFMGDGSRSYREIKIQIASCCQMGVKMPFPAEKMRFRGEGTWHWRKTNVQQLIKRAKWFGLLFSFILFSSLCTKAVVKPLNSKKKSWRKNYEKL